MKNESIDDLRLLFLRLIAEETPEAACVLFSLRDASEWMRYYGVSADWLEAFLKDVLGQGQEHIDWVVKNREAFGQASFWSRPRKRPVKQPPGRSAQAEAWLRTLQLYETGQATLREAEKVAPDWVTYFDPVIDKRKGERHCLWLVQRRFGEKSDTDIQRDTGVSRSEIGNLRRKFARAIGLNFKKRRRP